MTTRSESPGFEAKARLLEAIDAYARAKDPRVRQVSVSLGARGKPMEVVRGDGETYRDLRPLVRLNVSIVAATASARKPAARAMADARPTGVLSCRYWRAAVDDAIRQALTNLESVPAPAGEMDVVLGPGWPGVMLHEAVGHGLEGDFNRKKTSAFAGLMGQRSRRRASPWWTTARWPAARLAHDRRRRHARPTAPY